MSKVRVVIRHREKKNTVEFPQLDYQTLLNHIELLCTSKELGFGVVTTEWEHFCFFLGGQILKPEDFHKEDRLQLISAGGLELVIKPTTPSEKRTELEVLGAIADLKDKEDTVIKNVCFRLKKQLKSDDLFVKIFHNKNGPVDLVRTICDSNGSRLSYGFGALDSYMAHYQFTGGVQLFDKILKSLTTTNVSVAISALHTLNMFISPNGNQKKGAAIYWSNGKKNIPTDELAKKFVSITEDNYKLEILTLFNNLLSLTPPDRKYNAATISLLESTGVTTALIEPKLATSNRDGKEWNNEIHRLQCHILDMLTYERNVEFKEDDNEHVSLLKKFWEDFKPNS